MGIYGYILKEFAIAELEYCIACVLREYHYFSPELIEYIEIKKTPEALKTLTDSEIKVLKHIADNKTAKEIANDLSISDRTVEKHKSNIRTKLNLASKASSMVLYAQEHKTFLEKYK